MSFKDFSTGQKPVNKNKPAGQPATDAASPPAKTDPPAKADPAPKP